MASEQKKPIRVLHAPLNFANQAYILSKALRREGIESALATYEWGDAPNKYGFDADTSIPISFTNWLGDEFAVLQKVLNGEYDIVHFWNRTLVYHGSGDNFFNGLDLPYLRMAGPRTAYRFTGYELRRKSLELELNPFSPFRYGFESRHKEDDQKRYLDYVAPYINVFLVQDPEMQSYLPQARIVPRALDLDRFPVETPASKKRPLVVHAPTNRLLKGSDFVLKAVQTLKDEHLAFDFQLIEDMPQSQAFEWYKRADIVIDQLLIGWYGVVALEAMAMGKTIIAYIRDDLTNFFRGQNPLIIANPETITAALRQAVQDASLRRELAQRARAFVEEVHDCRKVAKSLADLYREILEPGTAPVRTPDLTFQISCGANLVSELSIAQAARLRHIPALYKAQFTIKRLEREMAALENKNVLLSQDAEFFRENTIVNRYLRFARHCHERAGDLKAEAYSAYGVEALPAADAVAECAGGRVYCDVIEIPSFADRNVTVAWHPTNLALLDHAFEGFLRTANGLLTVGWALKGEIQHYGPSVSVIPNYRSAEELQASPKVREMCGLRSGDRLVLSISTMTSGFEAIIEALTLLPMNVHLATLGNFVPAEYDAQIRALIACLGLGERVHLFQSVPYDQLTSTASGADAGLIALDPAIRNHRISLPNRLFDYMAASLPVVAPDIPDIARIVKERGFGVVLGGIDARSWADGIRAALAARAKFRSNAAAASKELVWESLAEQLHATYDNASSITFVGYRDLTGNRRTMRIARTLAERGVKVTVCCPHEEPDPTDQWAGVRFVFTPPLVHAVRSTAPAAGAQPAQRQNAGVPDRRPAQAHQARAPQKAPPPVSTEELVGATKTALADSPPPRPAAPAQPAARPAASGASSPSKAERLDTEKEKLRAEMLALRYKARRYDELAAELPALRHQALRFNEVKDQLPTWRAKADRFDQLIPRRRQKGLPIVGWRLPLVGRLLASAGLSRLTRSRSEANPGAKAPAAKEGPVAASPPSRNGAPDPAGSATANKAQICILSRKDLRDITRVPRMAKALVDAGYGVTVISLRAPVQQLQDMCPETEYIGVAPRPLTGRLLGKINRRLEKRRKKRQTRREAFRKTVTRGGPGALALRAGSAAMVPLTWLGELARRAFVVTPCTLIFKKGDQKFLQAWRETAGKETLRALAPFIGQLHQWAMTHAFAKEADKATKDRGFDIVQAHDNYALVAAAGLAMRDKAKLVYDAVELSSHRLAKNLSWYEVIRERYERREEKVIFRKSDLMTTVGEGLATWYAENYSVARPLVVRNCRYYWPYERDGRLRADAGIGEDTRLVIWFGSAYPQQGIELLIDTMPLLPQHIHVAIVATALPRWVSYVNEELPRRAAALGVADRVHVLPPREPNDLVPYVSGANLGVIPRPSEHLNNFFSMPNKFLEMVMARLPIAVSQLGDIVDVINRYGIGEVFDERDLKSVATVIERMLDPETNRRLKENVMRAAEEMTWEKESVPYVAAVRALMPPAEASAPAGGDGTPRAERAAA